MIVVVTGDPEAARIAKAVSEIDPMGGAKRGEFLDKLLEFGLGQQQLPGGGGEPRRAGSGMG